MSKGVAMISGASRGIGAAIAARLVGDGWNVSLGVRGGRMPDFAAQLPPESVLACAYDAMTGKDEARWLAETRARFGPVGCIVANAGIMVAKSVIDAEDEEVAAMMEVNAFAPRRLVRAAWEDLRAGGRGRVVIVASLSGKRVKSALSGSYSMSKFAAVALAHGIRHAGFDAGIRATAVCPGFVATDMGLSLSGRPAEAMTSPDDLARVVSMLIDLPNEASVAEFAVNCQAEEFF
ncbi:SDR family NAD(P)-dependent oxidoreductase (plasmid) [Shinella sp. PSBB067]|uniref:SDR family NAD(P)-dependent oxidoreductase n=1 Tax=Shinella sp. PSBB067 TaxID=2715959 RepID=UPI00193C364F|nr:SDR family NAD(P)-dependent oxidoreductase [Shinella sp. PSBB067]QRI66236.1 SDR family NAD(P)-dependent oxidoreductase [Shinella sp. PSBB067]